MPEDCIYKYFNRPLSKNLEITIRKTGKVMMPALSSKILIENVIIKPGESILDAGTGTGVTAIAVKMLGAKKVVGVDVKSEAIEEAKINAQLNGVEVEFIQSDLFENVSGKFDHIIANLPCIPSSKPIDVAYYGGYDGWLILDKFLNESKEYLNDNGRITFVFSSLCGLKRLMKYGDFRILFSIDVPFRDFYEVDHIKKLKDAEYKLINGVLYETAYVIEI